MADRSQNATRRQNERRKKRSREKVNEQADVGAIPAVVNPDRRAVCERDLHTFLTTYFPNSTGLKPFSESHLGAIARIQSCILEGGLFGQAFPRGSAKTTISENAVIWAAVYGHRRFPVLFGADANAASGNLDSIKTELCENDLLLEDFPEVCHPIRALEGKPQRCASQTHVPGNYADGTGEGVGDEDDEDGPTPQLTHIAWTADTIILPTITRPDGTHTPSSGAIIATRGIESGSRGLKHKRPDGTQQRPDLVLLDDPQTDKSAATPAQVEKRESIIRKNILKLGGHNRAIAFIMNATVIKQGDLVVRMMNPKLWPALQSVRIKMVTSWAKAHDTLWLTDYARLRNTYDGDVLGDQQRAHKEATEFYRRNRDKMDEGCVVFWEHCHTDTELSAIQHAYNMLIDDGEEVFASECQNDPLSEEADEKEQLKADDVAGKVNNLPRGILPASANRLTVFIDPKKSHLMFTALATGDGFTGSIPDYGAFPDQGKAYFAARDVRKTIITEARKAGVNGGLQAAVYWALDTLVNKIMEREWKRDGDGAAFKPERILIDANWGEITDTVYTFCRQSRHAAILLPSHGKFFGAKTRPLSEYKKSPGDRTGPGWRMPAEKGKRYVLLDVNYWKTFVADRLRAAFGDRGCLSLFGVKGELAVERGDLHRMFAEHMTSERAVAVEAAGRRVTEWEMKPGRPDNDLLDCVVGAHAAASIQGAVLLEGAAKVVRVKVKWSEKQKTAKHFPLKK